MATMS